MSKSFYSAFDQECLRDDFNQARTEDYRSIFHQDRDRVMFTPSFRRLQSKTQVFQTGEYDFYRTRLTHSLEVANIAKSIVVWLRYLRPELAIDPDVIEAICLSHDIGHPPFGHSGERVLNEIMQPYGGFEGNAQSLRILTRTIYSQQQARGGMSPSRTLLDGILKYKRLFRDRGTDTHHFLYDEQERLLQFCFAGEDVSALLASNPNQLRSIECQIMDFADDIAYSCFDIVDGVQARFVSCDKLNQWREENEQGLSSSEQKNLEELVNMVRDNRLVPRMNRVIGELIQSSSIHLQEGPLAGKSLRYSYRLEIAQPARARMQLHKRLCLDLVFGSTALRQVEFKGRSLVKALAGAFFAHYVETKRTRLDNMQMLLPSGVHRMIVSCPQVWDRARLVCDYLSGMTDAYAVRCYKRLFDPTYGSISELL